MYYVVLLYLMFLFLFKNKFTDKQILIVSIIPLCIMILLRYGIGPDYFSYEYIYDSLNTTDWNIFFSSFTNIELVFKLIILFFNKLNISFHIFFSMMNMIILIFIFLWIKDNSDDITLSIIVLYSMFYFVWVLSAVRQGLVLSIGSYLFINKKKELDNKKSIFIIFLLSLIHTTGLVYLGILLLKKYNFSKKAHLKIISIGLILSLVPFDVILSPLKFIKSVDWLLLIYNKRSPFFSIASFMRIFFFVIFYLYYDELSKDKSYKKFLDYFLFGNSIYFSLKFSEITASRITIHTFILLIIILPKLYNSIKANIEMKKIRISFVATLLFLSFNLFYLHKEINTMAKQSGIISKEYYYKFPNIYSTNIDLFDTRYSFAIMHKRQWQEIKDEYKLPTSSAVFNSDNSYTLVSSKFNNQKQYGVLSNEKKWLIENDHIKNARNVELINNILVINRNKNIFEYVEFLDVTGQERNEDILRSLVYPVKNRELFSNGNDERIIHKEELNIDKIIDQLYDDINAVEIKSASRIRNGDTYYNIINIDYKGESHYIYLNENFELLFNNIILNAVKLDEQGFGVFKTYVGDFIGYVDGTIIWWND